jgi:uncharacterized protein (DUF1015 family)
MSDDPRPGLSLDAFRALRPRATGSALASLLCPPYDVIDDAERARLLADPDNAVSVILPRANQGEDPYQQAAERLDEWVASGHMAVDDRPSIYVYEMRDDAGSTTRGLLGAIELRDPIDGVILPHENTMAGPVADRLALMQATQSNLEPIYLVYDGGGAASEAVSAADQQAAVAETTTPDGITHRLWALTDPEVLTRIAADLGSRRALIADGHHRYATYRELQRDYDATRGTGPWDRGLTLLVDSSSYGPQVHAIHRVLPGFVLADAAQGAAALADVGSAENLDQALRRMEATGGFAVVLSDGRSFAVVTDPDGNLAEATRRVGEPTALAELDVSVLHRGLVERAWGLVDDVDTVGYAHSIDEALAGARASGGTAVLLRPTPVAAVAGVAAAGARMPRKSTLFTPKPASGLVMRRFADEQ